MDSPGTASKFPGLRAITPNAVEVKKLESQTFRHSPWLEAEKLGAIVVVRAEL